MHISMDPLDNYLFPCEKACSLVIRITILVQYTSPFKILSTHLQTTNFYLEIWGFSGLLFFCKIHHLACKELQLALVLLEEAGVWVIIQSIFNK